MIERLRVQIPAGAAGEFSSPELLLFGVPSAPVLRQWHVKDPGHSAKKKKKKNGGGRLHLTTLTPLTQRSRSGLSLSLPTFLSYSISFSLTPFTQAETHLQTMITKTILNESRGLELVCEQMLHAGSMRNVHTFQLPRKPRVIVSAACT